MLWKQRAILCRLVLVTGCCLCHQIGVALDCTGLVAMLSQDLLEDSEEADKQNLMVLASHLARLEGLLTKAAEERRTFLETFAAELQVHPKETYLFCKAPISIMPRESNL